MSVFHSQLPHFPWMDARLARLPGVLPLDGADFLNRDEAFAGQMALRDRLIAQSTDLVHGLQPQAAVAAQELYNLVLAHISKDSGYRLAGQSCLRPDGVDVVLERANPLLTLGRLVQEDLCILQKQDSEHHLTGAILCFPASWALHQKLGRPMSRIHAPVGSYTPDLALRVQRMLNVIRPEQPLWRMNYLTYASADLHHPRVEEAPRDRSESIPKPFVRCERQCFVRLPVTGAVVFSIHSYLMPIAQLPPDAQTSLSEISH
jgi:hypothetical protein